MKTLRVGGVPEHFNYPIHKAISNKSFSKAGLEIDWNDYSGGTGAMAEALRSKEIDFALLLTEGAVSFIAKGDEFRIIQVYVQSPLNWGIHVPYESDLKTVEDIQGKMYAISRFGSGSHLMSFVDADRRGWDTNDLKFKIVGNLPGAADSFKAGDSEVFFWEKFTTQPYVTNKYFRRVGECPTPWPCFVLVGRKDHINANKEDLSRLVDLIINSAHSVKHDEQSDVEIAKMYDLELDQVRLWKSETQWASDRKVSPNIIKEVFEYLHKLGLVEGSFDAEKFIASLD